MLEYKATDIPGQSLYDKQFGVQIRAVTPIEQKLILSLSQKEQKTSTDYLNFLKKLIQIDNPEVTLEDLYWFDVQYLLYRIRHTTYSKYPLKLGFRCSECGESFTHTLDIGKLDIITPDDIEMAKTVTLDNLGELPIRCKKVKDDIIIEDFIRKHKLDIEDIQTRLLLLDLCLLSDYKPLPELYMLAEQGEITANDIVTVEKWFENSLWGVKEIVDVKCPHCEKEASKGYMLSIEDFFSIV